MKTTTTYPKRLIEVDLPIRQISEHARREKSSSTITGLHLWWARRPLAACRAVLCATLWLDPADPECPQGFRTFLLSTLSKFGSRVTKDRELGELCVESWQYWGGLSRAAGNPDSDETLVFVRTLLLAFIADFSNPKAASSPEFIRLAGMITAKSHECIDGTVSAPLVADPFAGGGSIPVEALRVGANSVALESNPVALMINDVLVRAAPEFGDRLRNATTLTADAIYTKAKSELEQLYPRHGKLIPIAYIWARTVLSEAPADGDVPVEVPLLRSMWLSKRHGDKQALRWVRDKKKRIVCDRVQVSIAGAASTLVRRPRLEIFSPKSDREVESGTCSASSATCPVSGYITPKPRIRVQLMARRGGTRDARLIAVALKMEGGGGREYHLPTRADERARQRAEELVSVLDDVPDEPLPVGRVWKNNPFRVHLYGMTTWGDLFSARQLVALMTIGNAVRKLSEFPNHHDAGLNQAVHEVLSLSVSRLADHFNSGCRWNPTGEKLQQLFARQAVPMVWDFCEANPFGGSVGDWGAMAGNAARALSFTPVSNTHGEVIQASALDCPLPDDSVDALVTDPPYYDSVPYADLSEFFYVWLKRTVPNARAEWFKHRLVDRDAEIVFDENRGKDAEYYVRAMTKALAEARRVTKPTGIGVVVFAHKSTSGWEALLRAIVDAGWVVTGSWPIDTELATRVRAMNSAALGSSVHIVCRPRENADGSVRTDQVGDWREVQRELPIRIHTWMPRLAAEGVVGADAIFACIGPALEIFSRYSRVERASGEEVTLKEYLEKVWEAVAKEALSMIFEGAETLGFEEDARLTAMWLWTLSTAKGQDDIGSMVTVALNPEEEDESPREKKKLRGYTLEYDAARKIAQGLGAHLEDLDHLVEIKGEFARLLPVDERSRYLFGKEAREEAAPKRGRKKQMGLFEEAADPEIEATWGELSASRPGDTALDRVHQAMLLHASNRGAALKRFLVEDAVGADERFWRLAQALSALYPQKSDEKRWVDGLLARKKGLGF